LSAGLDQDGKLVGCMSACRANRSTPWPIRPCVGGPDERRSRAGTRSRAMPPARLFGAEPRDRICDAQHPCAGRTMARRPIPTRHGLYNGMLHGRGWRARREKIRSRSAAAHGKFPKHLAVLNAAAPRPLRQAVAGRLIAASPSSWAWHYSARSPRFSVSRRASSRWPPICRITAWPMRRSTRP